MSLYLAQDADADALLDRDPFALLLGMMLDQQIPMEKAFAGPKLLAERMGADRLEPADIAGHDPETFAKLFAGPPAIHRFPGAMAARAQSLARVVAERYLPSLVLAGGPQADGIALLEGRGGAEPTAYVCHAYACDAPTSDAAMLASQLEAIVAPVTVS